MTEYLFAQCATSLGLTNELKIPNTAVGEIDRYLSVTIDESVMSFWEDNSKNAEQFPRLLGTQEAFQLLQLRWKEYSALLVTLWTLGVKVVCRTVWLKTWCWQSVMQTCFHKLSICRHHVFILFVILRMCNNCMKVMLCSLSSLSYEQVLHRLASILCCLWWHLIVILID